MTFFLLIMLNVKNKILDFFFSFNFFLQGLQGGRRRRRLEKKILNNNNRVWPSLYAKIKKNRLLPPSRFVFLFFFFFFFSTFFVVVISFIPGNKESEHHILSWQVVGENEPGKTLFFLLTILKYRILSPPRPASPLVTVFKTNVKLSLCFYDTTQL